MKKAEVFKIPLNLIGVEFGFNPRDLSKSETLQKIASIKQAYKAGDYVKPLEVRLRGSKIEVVDGHCRRQAAIEARAELIAEGFSNPIPFLMCIPFKGNDLDRLVLTVHGNEGEKLTPMECAEVVRRMSGLGLNRANIAERLRVSIGWVDRLTLLNKLPELVKHRIRSGLVSPDVAVAVFKAEGEGGVIAALDVKANAAGGAKITAKHNKLPGVSREAQRAEKQAINKNIEAQLRVAESIAFGLPEKLFTGEIMDEEVYSVKLNGATLKSLRALKENFAGKHVLKS
ncbi:hypothetical protein [Rugamonas sp.]|uniref:ParB/RepB/Spo0J family partition protein n=1 Tax=Rugamonas sp. TaxID=1926287 RepID=UPI0025E79B43|nr:hypothetical protein [Rugamonas sp.]